MRCIEKTDTGGNVKAQKRLRVSITRRETTPTLKKRNRKTSDGGRDIGI